MVINMLCSVMESMASQGRWGFANAMQSNGVVRPFKAPNHDITFRNAENKEIEKNKN